MPSPKGKYPIVVYFDFNAGYGWMKAKGTVGHLSVRGATVASNLVAGTGFELRRPSHQRLQARSAVWLVADKGYCASHPSHRSSVDRMRSRLFGVSSMSCEIVSQICRASSAGTRLLLP